MSEIEEDADDTPDVWDVLAKDKEQDNATIARLTRERDDLRIALRKIACDPLTDNPEASPAECLAECERIAWEALGINEPNTEKESG